MKNMTIIIIAMVLLYGCNGGGGSSSSESVVVTTIDDVRTSDSGFMPGWSEWVSSEWPSNSRPKSEQNGEIDLDLAKKIVWDAHQEISYQYVGEHWQPSEETLSLKTGDCKAYAILIYVRWRNAGFPDENIGMTVLHNEKGEWHTIPTIFMNGKVMMFDLQSFEGWTLLQSFNIFQCWRYDGK